jgi:hypothetical protein
VPRTLSPGQWREVSIDFSTAKRVASTVTSTETCTSTLDAVYASTPVANLNDVRRIGFSLSGAGTSNGNTVLYVDNVVARGTSTVLGLALNTTTYWFWGVAPLGSTTSPTSFDFENTGNVNLKLKLKTSNSSPGNWAPSTSAPGAGVYVLNAQFNSSQPGSFTEANHALTTSDVAASGTQFAGDEQGTNLAPGDVRHLWFQFRAPSVTSASDSQKQSLTIGVTAEIQ